MKVTLTPQRERVVHSCIWAAVVLEVANLIVNGLNGWVLLYLLSGLFIIAGALVGVAVDRFLFRPGEEK
jgi:hypothetical protein